MSTAWIATLLQILVAAGLLNVWLVRAKSPTAYRGGASQSLKDEFAAYGLPEAMFYLVGFLKIGAAGLLIAGVWMPALVRPAAAVVAVLMAGAIVMHVRVKDPASKSVPAVLMLAMCGALVFLAG